MKTIELKTDIKSYSFDELKPDESALVAAAREATGRSYAPYSKFCVGAAIELEDGTVIQGSNQENVAYPSGTCAERTAAFYAHSRYPGVPFKAIAIAARGTDGEFVKDPISPCGACRQVLLQYEALAGHNVPVYLASATEVYRLDSVSSLLPLGFISF